jgi:hypothetical protein
MMRPHGLLIAAAVAALAWGPLLARQIPPVAAVQMLGGRRVPHRPSGVAAARREARKARRRK